MVIYLIFFIALAVLVSFLCSLLEATILSVSIPYAKVLMDKGHRSGRILYRLKRRIDRPLAAILTMNTVANTLGATGAGAQALLVFGNEWMALFSALFTLTILIVSEIIPKTLGSIYWRTLAPYAAYIIRIMIIIVYPLVIITQSLAKFFTLKKSMPRVTREELVAMTKIGEDDGALYDQEERCILNLLKLSRIPVESIMTPISVVEMYPDNYTVDQIMKEVRFPKFSRIPIYHEKSNKLTGVVLRSEILMAAAKDNHSLVINRLARPVHIVRETDSVRNTLDEFIQKKEHLFAVTDNSGNFTGIVTLEDTIETLLGTEIIDESDMIVDMRKYALRKFKSLSKIPRFKIKTGKKTK